MKKISLILFTIICFSINAQNSLQDGASPYNSYFGNGVYYNESYNEIEFKNTQSSDVVVCLVNYYSGKTIRNEYIQKGNTFKMTKIPNGTYMVKVFYGNDWNPYKELANGKIIGGFNYDESFSISDDRSDLLKLNQYETSTEINYSTYEVTLYAVYNGNMEQREISEQVFFN